MSQQSSTTALRTTGIATVMTVLFYVAAPQIPTIGPFVQRYFCGHPLEYVCTAMFFTGMAVLLQKLSRTQRDMQALAGWKSAEKFSSEEESQDTADKLFNWLREQPAKTHFTHLHNRIIAAVHYVRTSGTRGFEDHLRYLADVAAERTQQGFAVIRTITWAIPIVGFLGTVIGITMAIANVTPEQLDTSLGEVTGGLSVAFDTTALALGMSIGLVFLSFAAERLEQSTLNEIEQLAITDLLPLFATHNSDQEVVTTQPTFDTGAWQQQTVDLQNLWTRVLSDHSDQLASALTHEVQRTLKVHRLDAETTRESYANTLAATADRIVGQTTKVLETFERRIGAWQEAICETTQASVGQSEALHELGAVLLKMNESEERLARLQRQLNDNLNSVRLAETVEESANSLTAAVHVLTARTSERRAA